MQILNLLLKKISSCQPSDKRSYTEIYQSHTAISFGYKVVCHYDKKYLKDIVIYRGQDPIGEVLKCMFREVQNCQKVIRDNFNKPLKMSKKDKINLEKATHCHICEKKIYKPDDGPGQEPVRDHRHLLVNIVVLHRKIAI